MKLIRLVSFPFVQNFLQSLEYTRILQPQCLLNILTGHLMHHITQILQFLVKIKLGISFQQESLRVEFVRE